MCIAFQFANLDASESDGNSPATRFITAGLDKDMFLFCGRDFVLVAIVELYAMGSSSPS